jgi:DNA-binding XRE family transcriptional regulator
MVPRPRRLTHVRNLIAAVYAPAYINVYGYFASQRGRLRLVMRSMQSTQPHHRKTRREPNHNDPLSEPTLQRRIWAAYLQRGYNRKTWAESLHTSYSAVDAIDTGKVTPKLAMLMKMAKLVGYSLDELVFGRDVPPRLSGAELSDAQVRALLLDIGTGTEAADALGQHVASPSGRFMPLTRAYVSAFALAFEAARAEELDPRASIDAAKRAAINAQANAEAVAQRLHPVGRSAPTRESSADVDATAPRKRAQRGRA